MGQLFIEKRFEKLTRWLAKCTAEQQAKLAVRVIGDKYDTPECRALAGFVIAFLIFLVSWLVIGPANFIPSVESIWLRTLVVLFCWLLRIFLSILAIWCAAGAFSYPVRVVFVDIPKGGSIRSVTRSILLLFVNYFEIVVHFSSLYILTRSIEYEHCLSNFVSMPKAIYFSIVTITTLGDTRFAPVTFLGLILVSVEVLVGIIMIVAVLAGFLQERDKEIKQQN